MDVRPTPPAYDPDLDRALRRIARRFVTDAAAADDVVQEAWLAALAERRLRRPAAWLKAVTARLARGARRQSELQRAHEERAARPEALEGGDGAEVRELSESIERMLANQHGRIGEVLRLRYAEGLKLREIARRLGVPLGTIKADHVRGLRRVRESLEREGGDPRRTALALIPFAAVEREAGASGVLGGAVVSLLAAAAAAVFVVLIGRGLWWAGPAPVVAAEAPPEREAVGIALATAHDVHDEAHGAVRREVPASTDVATSHAETALVEPAEVSATHAVIALEVGSRDEPLVGARVVAYGAEAREVAHAITDARGWAELELPDVGLRGPSVPGGPPTVLVDVVSDALAAPRQLLVEVHAGAQRTFSVSQDEPALAVSGVVVDELGAPLAGVTVLVNAETFAPEPVDDGAWWVSRIERAVTDSGGRFRLARLAPGATTLVCTEPAHLPVHQAVELPTSGTHELAEPLVLRRGAALVGRVVDADGAPVAGAVVWLESQDESPVRRRTRSDAAGEFALHGAAPGADIAWVLRRVPSGFVTASTPVELRLAEPTDWQVAPASRGLGVLRVVDGAGAPLVDWRVRVRTIEPVRRFNELVVTDDDGRVVLPRDPGVPVRAAVLPATQANDAAAMPVATFELAAAWEGTQTLVVAAAHAARGGVTARLAAVDGSAADGFELVLQAEDQQFSLRVAPDADGSFQVDGLVAGRYGLYVRRPGGAYVLLAAFELAPGEARALGELRAPA